MLGARPDHTGKPMIIVSYKFTFAFLSANSVAPNPIAPAASAAPAAAAAPTGEGLEVLAPLEGKAYMVSNSSETPKKVGDHVEEGDIICYIEAMKVFNRIKAEKAGTITSINFTSGDSVEEDDVLMTIA